MLESPRIVVCCWCGNRMIEDGKLKSRFEGAGEPCNKCGRIIKIIHREIVQPIGVPYSKN